METRTHSLLNKVQNAVQDSSWELCLTVLFDLEEDVEGLSPRQQKSALKRIKKLARAVQEDVENLRIRLRNLDAYVARAIETGEL